MRVLWETLDSVSVSINAAVGVEVSMMKYMGVSLGDVWETLGFWDQGGGHVCCRERLNAWKDCRMTMWQDARKVYWERLLGVPYGEFLTVRFPCALMPQVLYVGDHIYGDIGEMDFVQHRAPYANALTS